MVADYLKSLIRGVARDQEPTYAITVRRFNRDTGGFSERAKAETDLAKQEAYRKYRSYIKASDDCFRKSEIADLSTEVMDALKYVIALEAPSQELSGYGVVDYFFTSNCSLINEKLD